MSQLICSINLACKYITPSIQAKILMLLRISHRCQRGHFSYQSSLPQFCHGFLCKRPIGSASGNKKEVLHDHYD